MRNFGELAQNPDFQGTTRHWARLLRMRRAILHFMLGMISTALFIAAATVYVFHDVDNDKIGHWNQAFGGLVTECILFTLIVGGGVALLTLLGRQLFHLKGYYPHAKLGFYLGIGVTVLQYPWDFAGRALFPKLANSSLALYLVLAIVISAVVLVRDTLKQMRLSQEPAAAQDSGRV